MTARNTPAGEEPKTTRGTPPGEELALSRTSEIPLGTQLTWKLQVLMATGRLKPGDRLPPVRALAEQAGVNVNTVRSVYARLEEQRLVSSQHGRGTFVADDAAANVELGRLAAQVAADARSSGMDPREVAAAIYASADISPLPETDEEEGPDGRAGGSDEREYRRELLRQIGELERQVTYYTRHHVGRPVSSSGPRAGRLLSTPQLLDMREELLGRVTELRAEEDQRRRLVIDARAQQEEAAQVERAREVQSPQAAQQSTVRRPPRLVRSAAGWSLQWRA